MGRIKNIIQKIKYFLFKEHFISKNNNCVPFFCLSSNEKYNKIINEKIYYDVSPFKFYLEKNFEKFFGKLLLEFKNIEIKPQIGLESEFFATNVLDKNYFFVKIYDFAKENNIKLNKIKEENCKNQFELEFLPYTDLLKLINDFNIIKKFLLSSSFQTDFSAKPFYYNVGSSLQINISLIDKNGNNLFRKRDNNLESTIMLHSIAGLLSKTNEFLDLYTKSENCMIRYDIEFNKLHQISGNITSPSYNCWGINNRTCSIRIPTSKKFLSNEEYIKDTLKNRRIEYRIPSSDCDIRLALYGTLYSVLYGINNELYPTEKTSNNVISDDFSYLKYEIIKK